MLRGRFGDSTGRPYIEGRLLLPRLGIRSDISFLMDTGADKSLLMPMDAQRMGIDYTQLTGDSPTIGIGGISHNYLETAYIVFSDPRYLYMCLVELEIASLAPDTEDIPSLLGRDVLNRWRIIYEPTRKRLNCTVLSADFTTPIPMPNQ